MFGVGCARALAGPAMEFSHGAAYSPLPSRGKAMFASHSGQRLDRMRGHRIIKAARRPWG